MNLSNNGASSVWMALARIAIGVMFLFFAQYKLVHRDFANGGYQKYVQSWVQDTSVDFYKPVLRMTLKHPAFFAYGVAVAELLIGLSLVLGWWTRVFSVVAALFMLNLIFATWKLPPGAAYWRYLGNQLENIPLFLLFIIFIAHNAGATMGMDKGRG